MGEYIDPGVQREVAKREYERRRKELDRQMVAFLNQPDVGWVAAVFEDEVRTRWERFLVETGRDDVGFERFLERYKRLF